MKTQHSPRAAASSRLLKQTLCAFGICSLSATVASAQTLAIDFGHNYVPGASNINTTRPGLSSGDYDADFDGTVDDRSTNIEFGGIFSATGSANWANKPDGTNGTIRFGASIARLNDTVNPDFNLIRINTNDIIQVTNTAGTATMRMAAAFYWEKSDFLNGLSTDTSGLTFDSSVNLSASFTSAVGTPTNRIIARNGTTWYVSDTNSSGANPLAFNGATTTWYLFNPQVGTIFVNTTSFGAGVLGSTLTDITALGVYMQHELFNGTTGNAAIAGFNLLQVSLTAIPEPSSTAALLGLSALGLVATRRCRKSS